MLYLSREFLQDIVQFLVLEKLLNLVKLDRSAMHVLHLLQY
jgi:hypothetical protein